MRVYHLGDVRFAKDLTGEGARLFGGRWNNKGTACIYTSQHRSLCVLEYAAHLGTDDLLPGLCFTEYDLPNDSWKVIAEKDLPADWAAVPAAASTKLLGTALLQDKNILAFRVPSALLPAEYNFVLNPAATVFKKIKLIGTQPFTLDKRIKQQ